MQPSSATPPAWNRCDGGCGGGWLFAADRDHGDEGCVDQHIGHSRGCERVADPGEEHSEGDADGQWKQGDRAPALAPREDCSMSIVDPLRNLFAAGRLR